MKTPLLADLVASFLILLFGYTAVTKAFSHTSFQTQLEMLMNRTGAAVAAFLIPTSEAVIVLLLFFVRTRLTGLCAAAVLLGVFTLYLVYMLVALPHLPCSCGGIIGRMSWTQHAVFNLCCIGLCVAGIRLYKRPLTLRMR